MHLGYCDMTVGAQEFQSISMSPEETEAVLELWARRQSETDALRARTSVNDLAEAIAASPSDIESMLKEVRATRHLPPVTPNETKRRIRNRWLMAGAVAFWLAFLAFGVVMAYKAGLKNGRNHSTPWVSAPEAPVDFAIPPTPAIAGNGTAAVEVAADAGTTTLGNAQVEKDIPKGVSATFREYQIDGEGNGQELTEDSIKAGLARMLNLMVKPVNVQDSATYPGEMIIEALQKEDATRVARAIKFEPFKIVGQSSQFTLQMPYSLTSDYRITAYVKAEQDRKLQILANQAKRLGKKGS